MHSSAVLTTRGNRERYVNFACRVVAEVVVHRNMLRDSINIKKSLGLLLPVDNASNSSGAKKIRIDWGLC